MSDKDKDIFISCNFFMLFLKVDILTVTVPVLA